MAQCKEEFPNYKALSWSTVGCYAQRLRGGEWSLCRGGHRSLQILPWGTVWALAGPSRAPGSGCRMHRLLPGSHERSSSPAFSLVVASFCALGAPFLGCGPSWDSRAGSGHLMGTGNPETQATMASLWSWIFPDDYKGKGWLQQRSPLSFPANILLFLVPASSSSSWNPESPSSSWIQQGGHRWLPSPVSDGWQPCANPSSGKASKLWKLPNGADSKPHQRSETMQCGEKWTEI